MSVTELKTNAENANTEVVATLESMLQRAKDGEVVSIGICAVLTGGNIMDASAGGYDTAALLGASMLMQDSLKERFNDEG